MAALDESLETPKKQTLHAHTAGQQIIAHAIKKPEKTTLISAVTAITDIKLQIRKSRPDQ